MFLKKSKNLLDIKTSKQSYLEYKQTIALDLLTTCLQEKSLTDFTSLFSPYDFKKMML